MKHVIIGAGAAGITAAKTIRALQPHDEIVVVSEDKQIVSRVMVYKYISGEREVNELSFVPDDFFESNQIKWLRGYKVTGVNVAAKTVICEQETISYDKLLIAPGAVSTIPPIGGLKKAKNVFGLRHLSDAEAIREAALSAQKVVVVGAGLVGMAAASALLKMKKEVTVVEMGSRILSLNLDERAAATYQSQFEEAGCEFRLGHGVMYTTEDGEGNITNVVLDDDSSLSCDFVVVAAGARPEIEFLAGSSITCDRGIVVNDHLATNILDVYAAGDVTGLSGIWPNAMRQGEIAAKNMCGEPTVYEDTFAVKNTIHFFDLVTLTIGITEPAEGDVVELREDSKSYRKVILRDGRVVGLILQGDISNSGFWQYLIKNDIRVDNLDKPIWKTSFADFMDINEAGEYNWTVGE